LHDSHGHRVQHVLRTERLDTDLPELMSRLGLPFGLRHGDTVMNANGLVAEGNFTEKDLSKRALGLIRAYYEEDFRLLETLT
jgi:hypothetical protein